MNSRGNESVSFTTEYIAQLARLETKLEEVEKKTNSLDIISQNLTKLTIIQEQIVADNEKRDIERNHTNETINQINNSLNLLTSSIDSISGKLDNTTTKVNNLISQDTVKTEKVKGKWAFWATTIGAFLTAATAIILAILN